MATVIRGTGAKFTFNPDFFLDTNSDPGGPMFTESQQASLNFNVDQVEVPGSFRGGVITRVPGEITWSVNASGKLTDCSWPNSIDGSTGECTDTPVDFGQADFSGEASLYFNTDHYVTFTGVLTELRITSSGRDVARFAVTVRNADTDMTVSWAAP